MEKVILNGSLGIVCFYNIFHVQFQIFGFFYYKVLYVFDMDDTLLATPRLSNILTIENGEIKTSDESIQGFIEKVKGFFLSVFSKEICFEKSKTNYGHLKGIVHHLSNRYFLLLILHTGTKINELIRRRRKNSF